VFVTFVRDIVLDDEKMSIELTSGVNYSNCNQAGFAAGFGPVIHTVHRQYAHSAAPVYTQ
jgi:hypothetical protein